MSTAMNKLADELANETKTTVIGVDARDAWLVELEALFKRVDAWLQPLVKRKLVDIDSTSIVLSEPDLGTYQAPSRRLRFRTPAASLVRIEPRGSHIVGITLPGGSRVLKARGRVDLVAGPRCWALLRHDARKWWLVRVSEGSEKVELTEAAFATALRDVTRPAPSA